MPAPAQAAIEAEREELRAELVAEVGCPVLITYGPQLDAPLREALTWPAEMIDRFPWRRDLGTKDAFGMGVETERRWKEPIGVVGVIVPWNYPVEIILNKLGPLAMGNTRVPAGAGHAVERHPHRAARGRAHRHPGRRRQRRDVERPPRGRGAHRLAACRHGRLHRLDRHRPPGHAGGGHQHHAGSPGAGR